MSLSIVSRKRKRFLRLLKRKNISSRRVGDPRPLKTLLGGPSLSAVCAERVGLPIASLFVFMDLTRPGGWGIRRS